MGGWIDINRWMDGEIDRQIDIENDNSISINLSKKIADMELKLISRHSHL
jgi:hypothetical protein